MERAPVTSSNIASIGYEEACEILEIEFRSGSVYRYYNVPKAIFDTLMTAGSKGKFFHMYIKPAYPYEKV